MDDPKMNDDEADQHVDLQPIRVVAVTTYLAGTIRMCDRVARSPMAHTTLSVRERTCETHHEEETSPTPTTAERHHRLDQPGRRTTSQITAMGKGKRKFYAVGIGRRTGVFDSWGECEKQVCSVGSRSRSRDDAGPMS
jgi:hypothetical protein